MVAERPPVSIANLKRFMLDIFRGASGQCLQECNDEIFYIFNQIDYKYLLHQ